MALSPRDPDLSLAASKLDGSPELNALTAEVITSAIKVHGALGPGLLERVYRDALAVELTKRGRHVQVEAPLHAVYEGESLGEAYRMDLLVDGLVVVEIKSATEIHPVHVAQLLTYVRCGEKPAGLLLNFGQRYLRDGIRRVINARAPGA